MMKIKVAKVFRLALYVEKDDYLKLKSILSAKGINVSEWFRMVNKTFLEEENKRTKQEVDE